MFFTKSSALFSRPSALSIRETYKMKSRITINLYPRIWLSEPGLLQWHAQNTVFYFEQDANVQVQTDVPDHSYADDCLRDTWSGRSLGLGPHETVCITSE